MADRSAIEWTDATWNPIRARNRKTGKVGWHCEHATTGCINCYAEGFNKRLGTRLPFKPGHFDNGDIEIILHEDMLTQPLRWKQPRQVFVCSMTDLFARFVTDAMIDRMFAVMALSPQHTFQVLTKRADRMRDYMLERWQPAPARRLDLGRYEVLEIPAETEGADRRDQIAETVDSLIDDLGLTKRFRDTENDAHWTAGGDPICKQFHWPLPNVWLGVSVERQDEADARIPALLQTPAAVRFISAEPLLGPIDLNIFHQVDTPPVGHALVDAGAMSLVEGLEWVIAGGESGHGARPMHPAWARSLRDQCAAAGLPFFFKQWGTFVPEQTLPIAPGARDISDGTIVGESDSILRDIAYAGHGRSVTLMRRAGKKAAGRLLDGVEHNGFPEVRA